MSSLLQKRGAFLFAERTLRLQTHENEKWKTINVNKALLQIFLVAFLPFLPSRLMTNGNFTAAMESGIFLNQFSRE
jgi:hypothetical protein